jgi:hypothetical protein
LLVSHVLAGDGRFFDQLALLMLQSPTMSATPRSGNTTDAR